MKPLVEQMIIFLHPFSRLNSKLYENNRDKKKIYYVYYQGFTVILLG